MNTNEIVREKAGHNLPELLRIIAYPSFYRKDLEAAADLIESLQAQLAASQRREKAAAEDINSVRMCHTCKHFLREFGMGGIECKMPCATIRHENFDWRGAQEAGEGVTENE